MADWQTAGLAESPKGEPARPAPDDVSTAATEGSEERSESRAVERVRASETVPVGTNTVEERAGEGFGDGSSGNEHRGRESG
jgi:hypothetical protein